MSNFPKRYPPQKEGEFDIKKEFDRLTSAMHMCIDIQRLRDQPDNPVYLSCSDLVSRWIRIKKELYPEER